MIKLFKYWTNDALFFFFLNSTFIMKHWVYGVLNLILKKLRHKVVRNIVKQTCRNSLLNLESLYTSQY